MKLLLAGDSHGNSGYMVGALRIAAEAECAEVFQLGDFGIWPGDKGAAYLDRLDQTTKETGVSLSFLDGNHEDFEKLDTLAADKDRRLPDGRVLVRENILWCPRGTVIERADRRFGFLGGAVSVDKDHRVPFASWWPQENLTMDDLDVLVSNAGSTPLDVLLTHDAPLSVGLGWKTAYRDSPWPERVLREAEGTRHLLDMAVAATRPKVLVHGHWHLKHTTDSRHPEGHTFQAYGLDKEGLDGLAILDTDDLSLEWLS